MRAVAADEYARIGGLLHINTAECRFSLMKGAVYDVHHSSSEAHLQNTRKVKDWERAAVALKGIEGKRLTYRAA